MIFENLATQVPDCQLKLTLAGLGRLPLTPTRAKTARVGGPGLRGKMMGRGSTLCGHRFLWEIKQWLAAKDGAPGGGFGMANAKTGMFPVRPDFEADPSRLHV